MRRPALVLSKTSMASFGHVSDHYMLQAKPLAEIVNRHQHPTCRSSSNQELAAADIRPTNPGLQACRALASTGVSRLGAHHFLTTRSRILLNEVSPMSALRSQ